MITTYNAVLNDVWRETNVCEISGSGERTAGGHSEREARGGLSGTEEPIMRQGGLLCLKQCT